MIDREKLEVGETILCSFDHTYHYLYLGVGTWYPYWRSPDPKMASGDGLPNRVLLLDLTSWKARRTIMGNPVLMFRHGGPERMWTDYHICGEPGDCLGPGLCRM